MKLKTSKFTWRNQKDTLFICGFNLQRDWSVQKKINSQHFKPSKQIYASTTEHGQFTSVGNAIQLHAKQRLTEVYGVICIVLARM